MVAGVSLTHCVTSKRIEENSSAVAERWHRQYTAQNGGAVLIDEALEKSCAGKTILPGPSAYRRSTLDAGSSASSEVLEHAPEATRCVVRPRPLLQVLWPLGPTPQGARALQDLR